MFTCINTKFFLITVFSKVPIKQTLSGHVVLRTRGVIDCLRCWRSPCSSPRRAMIKPSSHGGAAIPQLQNPTAACAARARLSACGRAWLSADWIGVASGAQWPRILGQAQRSVFSVDIAKSMWAKASSISTNSYIMTKRGRSGANKE